jgi:hypothetical protein
MKPRIRQTHTVWRVVDFLYDDLYDLVYLSTFCAALIYPILCSPQVSVTLSLKSGGKRGATMPHTFASAADFAFYATTHDICLVSKDGVKKKGVHSLADAQSGEVGDCLLLTAPFDSLDEDVSNLKRAGSNMSGGQEQATTKAILTSPSLISEFGELRSVADGQGIIFFDHSGKPRLEVDGLVVSSAVVLVNEAKHTPTLADVSEQAPRKALLELILSNPSVYSTQPRDCLDAMVGITKVIPVISGYFFQPDVEAACRAAGVRCIKTNGFDYSSAC